jgi:hypothetical protein
MFVNPEELSLITLSERHSLFSLSQRDRNKEEELRTDYLTPTGLPSPAFINL